MKIALYDVDSKIPNLALMKLSAYHKAQGDQVEFYSPLFKYDKIYASKVYTDSDGGYLNRYKMIIGGSGYDLHSYLSQEIEHIYPDYSLYNCDYAIGFMTRGCIRKCEFCIVPEKEGMIKFNAHISEFCKDQKRIKLLDNNILAYKNHIELLNELIDSEKKIDFNQGLDIRLINNENAALLKQIKKWRNYELKFAFDDIKLESIIRKKVKILKQHGINRARFYILIGYNSLPKDDFKRVSILKELNQSIFAMRYEKDKYTTKFCRWINRFAYKKIKFSDYT